MADIPYRTALIVGAGAGISASLARGLTKAGLKVGLAARDTAKLAPLATETGAQAFAVDAADPAGVARLFERWMPSWGSRMSSSTTPALGRMARSPRSTRRLCSRRPASPPLAASWSPSRRHAGCCRAGGARSC